MTIFEADQGTAFGKWGDPVSRYMYERSLYQILPVVNMQGRIGDFGGANGLLKDHVSNVTTVDTDASKNPDVVADILDYPEFFDTVWCRYVLHYLTDQQVIKFVDNVNTDRLIIVQFVNDDLRGKYAASDNETKYFRTQEQLEALLPKHSKLLWQQGYTVTSDFYANRLKKFDAKTHSERLCVYEVIYGI